MEFSDAAASRPNAGKSWRNTTATSPRNGPDFAPENWCYGRGRPIVAVFVEITKPA
jgi:hypothetical protein